MKPVHPYVILNSLLLALALICAATLLGPPDGLVLAADRPAREQAKEQGKPQDKPKEAGSVRSKEERPPSTERESKGASEEKGSSKGGPTKDEGATGAAKASPKVSDEDSLIAELMDDVMTGLDKRLAFEAWADAR